VAVSASMTINPGPSTGAHVQDCYADSGNGSVNSVACSNFSSPQTLNNNNFCAVSASNGGWTATLADSNGNAYGSPILTTTRTGGGQIAMWLSSPIAAGANGSITATFNQAVAYPELKCAEYQGPLTTDVFIGATGTGTALNTGNKTTTNANDLLIGVDIAGGTITAACPGFTQRYLTSGGDILQDELVTVTGNYAACSTQSPSASWAIQMLAAAAPSGLVFPATNDGTTSAALTGTISNSGSSTITLNTPYFTITGTNAADFANAGTGTCTNGGTLTAGQACTANITITPSAAGARVATLNINGTASGTLALSGTGVGAAQCGTPTFSPVAGVVNSGTTVTFGNGCAGGTYCSTIDGSTPTANGAGTCTHGASGGTVTVSAPETVKAISSKSGNTDSLVGSAAYTLTLVTLGNPGFSPAAPYTGPALTVTLTCVVGATCGYTLDNTNPTTNGAGAIIHGNSFTGTAAVSITATTNILQIATEAGFTDSGIVSGLYTIPVIV